MANPNTACAIPGNPDPDGNSIEIYARLTPDELAERPENLEPTALA